MKEQAREIMFARRRSLELQKHYITMETTNGHLQWIVSLGSLILT